MKQAIYFVIKQKKHLCSSFQGMMLNFFLIDKALFEQKVNVQLFMFLKDAILLNLFTLKHLYQEQFHQQFLKVVNHDIIFLYIIYFKDNELIFILKFNIFDFVYPSYFKDNGYNF